MFHSGALRLIFLSLKTPVPSRKLIIALTALIGSVWIFHGLYSKVLQGIPRHRMIVGRVLGEDFAQPATVLIGVLEILVGLWAFSRWNRKACASVQTIGLVAMNVLEIALAKDLLISALGMVILNVAFLAMVWFWALAPAPRK